MLLAFFKEWGALCVSVLSLGVAALAWANSRRAVAVTAKEHEWKAGDRSEAEARRKWCEEQAEALQYQGGGITAAVFVPVEKIPWAKWGEENGYFRYSSDPVGRPVLLSWHD
jgi:hypothetical protein